MERAMSRSVLSVAALVCVSLLGGEGVVYGHGEAARCGGEQVDCYRIETDGVGVQLDGDGGATVSREAMRASLRLGAYGGQQAPPVRKMELGGDGVIWSDRGAVQEWWREVPGGAQHGWILHEPAPDGDERCLSVTLGDVLGVSSAQADGRVWLLDGQGVPSALYGGLVAWDAAGRVLETRMRAGAGAVELCVQTMGASWPVTVDPTVTFDTMLDLASGSFNVSRRLGGSVAVSGDWLAVGDVNDDQLNVNIGAVHLYKRLTPSNWNGKQTLKNFDYQSGFARTLAMNTDTLIVGTTKQSIHVYKRSASDVWAIETFVETETSVESATHRMEFTKADGGLALCGPWMLMGSPSARVTNKMTGGVSQGAGAVLLLRQNMQHPDKPWLGVGGLHMPISLADAGFGAAVACDGDWLAVSAPKAQRGVVVLYKYDATTEQWVERQQLLYPGQSSILFTDYGSKIAIDHDKLIVGNKGEERSLAGQARFPGAAHLYELDASETWNKTHTFYASVWDGTSISFGADVSVMRNTVLVGAPRGGSGMLFGEVYMYQPDGMGGWVETLWRNNGNSQAELGASVLLYQNQAFAGAPGFKYSASSTDVGRMFRRYFNTPPYGQDQQLTVLEDQTKRFKPDVQDDESFELTLRVVQPPARGVVRVVGDELEYVPELGQDYQTQFSYEASDGALASQPILVSVEVVNVNKAPVAQQQELSTAEDKRLTLVLVGSDPDGDIIRAYDVVRAPTRGQLVGSGNMRTYIPEAEFSGQDRFTFTVNDGMVDSAEAEVRITVTPVNDPPVFVAPLHEGTTRVEDGQPVSLSYAAMDVDSRQLSWSARGLPQGATFMGQTFAWTPTVEQSGQHSFEVVVSDGESEATLMQKLLVVFLDANGNGVPDVKERALVEGLSERADADGDGIRNFEEIGDRMAPSDTDRDGILDVFDEDSDGDGVSDRDEAGDADLLTPPVDSDADGTPDFQQVDSDGDGFEDGRDNCRRVVNPDQADRDGNGLGDACDDAGELPFAPSTRGEEGGCQQVPAGRAGSPLWLLVCGLVWRRRRASGGV
jgi:hypothetical protein